MINLVIPTFDRAFQMEALLRSIEQNCNIFGSISVITRWSNHKYEEAYHILFNQYPNVNWVEEKEFSQDIKTAMQTEFQYTCFMVDDIICYRKIDVIPYPKADEVAFSLRLGKNCKNAPDDYNHFTWADQTPYFDYPLSTDGHIFHTNFIKPLVNAMEFINPNQLEAKWQGLKNAAPPYMSCFFHSVVVSMPINKVSETSSCAAGDEFNYSQEHLNDLFLQGYRMDFNNMDFSNIKNPHQEIDIKVFK